MPALHDETSGAIQNVTPSLCLLLTPTHFLTRTLRLTLTLLFPWLYWRDNSVCTGDRLRQARIAPYAEVWIYVSHTREYTWHRSATLWL